MVLGHHKRAVGTFSTYQEAETALRELRDSGFSMDRVSLVGRDTDRHDQIAQGNAGDRIAEGTKHAAHDTEADEGAKTGAVTGGALGGLTGLLVGLGVAAIPGIGPIMLGGAAATALATTLAGGAIGAAAGGLVGGLVGLGIPEDRARVYSDRVSRGDYLIMVEGSEEEIRRAETILSRRGIQEWGIYDSPMSDSDQTVHPAATMPPTGTPYPGDPTRL
ncbi:MAG: general stress protein [Kovacikia sp.]